MGATGRLIAGNICRTVELGLSIASAICTGVTFLIEVFP